MSSSRKIKTWKIAITSVLAVLILLPAIALITISDRKPAVLETEQNISPDAAARTKRLIKELNSDIFSTVNQAKITFTQKDINSIFAFAMRGISRLKGRVNISPFGIEAALSFHVPENPLGGFINIRFGISPSNNGLHLSHASIGKLNLSGETALSLTEMFLNRLFGNSQGTQLIHSINSIAITSNNKATVIYKPVPEFKTALNNFKHEAKQIRNELSLLGDNETTLLYYQELCQFHLVTGNIKNVSLGYYLSSLFSLADKRTLLGKNPSDENQSALLALAIFLGSAEFNSLIGAISKTELSRCQDKKMSVALSGRQDLRLHFIYSAAFKIIANSNMSTAAGEFKELLDSLEGGSGFSFADLAADQAGIKFTELALNNNSASYVQANAISLIDEHSFFPSIDGLREGISQEEFEQRYSKNNSREYLSLLKKINQRIDKLPLFKEFNRNNSPSTQ